MPETPLTQYSAKTPWLIWDKWAKGQCYKTANPSWFKQFTRLWNDESDRAVWDVPGESDRRAALIFRLTQHMAVHSAIGAVWGDPVALQREMRMEEPPDLSWLLEAGWLLYITDAEKIEREKALAERGNRKTTAPKASSSKSAKPKRKTKERRGEERRGEESTEQQSGPSGKPARKKSVAAIAAPPGTGEPEAQREAQTEPEAQDGPQGPPQHAAPLSLVSQLPRPVPAALGPPGGPAALPPESDALGSGRPKARNPPPASSRSRASPQLLGSCLGPLAVAEQCPEVWDWVSSVYRLLRFPWPINSVEGRRETGSFSAMYNRVMAAALPSGKKTEILVSSLKTAEQKGRKPPGYFKKGRGAVFCDILNKRVKTHLARDG
jgi:hypothetical protein